MVFISNFRTHRFFMQGLFLLASITIHAGEGVDAKSGESAYDLSALIMKYAPELREHPDEKFPAVKAQWIWDRAGIMYNGQTIVQPGKIPSTDLSKIVVKVDGKDEPIMRTAQSQQMIKGLALIIPEEYYGGQDKGRKGRPLCYAHARPSLKGKAIDISYIFFNAYNGTPRRGFPV